MKVIIPVAGVGKRLRPHTESMPKPLLEVGGRPILDHVVRPLDGLDVDEVVFIIGHLGDKIRRHVRRHYSFKARFVEQDRLLGLGYAVSIALCEKEPGPVLILLGDTIVDCEMRDFISAGDYVLGVHEVANPHRFGIAELAGGFVSAVQEKPEDPKTNLALIGLYYFADAAGLKTALARLVQSGMTTSGEIQLTDALAAMLADGVKFVPYNISHWYDCGERETLLATNRFLLDRMESSGAPDGSTVTPPVHIDSSAVIIDSEIGPYVSVGVGARIENSVISNSIVASESEIVNANIRDSLVGTKAVVRGRQGVVNIGEHSEIDDD